MALDVVLAGKHNGSTHAAVAETDRSYCHWVMNAAMLPRSLLPFKTWLKRTHGGVLPCGKYKNGFLCTPYGHGGPYCTAIYCHILSYCHTAVLPHIHI